MKCLFCVKFECKWARQFMRQSDVHLQSHLCNILSVQEQGGEILIVYRRCSCCWSSHEYNRECLFLCQCYCAVVRQINALRKRYGIVLPLLGAHHSARWAAMYSTPSSHGVTTTPLNHCSGVVCAMQYIVCEIVYLLCWTCVAMAGTMHPFCDL